MIAGLFPDEVSLQFSTGIEGDPLIGCERELGEGLAEKVHKLFMMGRDAAHRALKEVGANKLEIGRGAKREPIWPEGFIGSIAHTEGLAVAVATKKSKFSGLGIDVELMDREFRFPIEEKIASETERKWIMEEPGKQRERTLVLFSAKEATFKAFFPLEQVYLNFLDVEFTPTEGGFKASLNKAAGAKWPRGFSFDVLQSGWKGYLVSALTLE